MKMFNCETQINGTSLVAADQWEQKMLFSVRASSGTVWDGMPDDTSLSSSKSYCHFIFEKYHTGVSHGHYQPVCTADYLRSTTVLSWEACISQEAWLSAQNAPETVCWPGSTRTHREAHSTPQTSWLDLGRESPGPQTDIKGRERKRKEGNGKGRNGGKGDKVLYWHFFPCPAVFCTSPSPALLMWNTVGYRPNSLLFVTRYSQQVNLSHYKMVCC